MSTVTWSTGNCRVRNRNVQSVDGVCARCVLGAVEV
jgi:hypothetical protein